MRVEESALFSAMKCIVQISVLSIAFMPCGLADLTLSQEVEGGPQKGEIVMRVKGDRLRLDLRGGPTGPMSTILNGKTGEALTLVHAKKFAIKRNGDQAKQAARDVSKTAEPPKPAATSLTERVGEYEAEVYTMTVDGSKDTLWVVRDYPNFPAIREDLRRVSHATIAGLNRAGTLDVTTLPGMVVKRQKERGGKKVTITLKSVSLDAIEESIFETPATYKLVAPKN